MNQKEYGAIKPTHQKNQYNHTITGRYPGLYWNTMEWEQCYPDSESLCEFHNRTNHFPTANAEMVGVEIAKPADAG